MAIQLVDTLVLLEYILFMEYKHHLKLVKYENFLVKTYSNYQKHGHFGVEYSFLVKKYLNYLKHGYFGVEHNQSMVMVELPMSFYYL